MSMKLYVGNLAFTTSSQDLQELIAQAGTVELGMGHGVPNLFFVAHVDRLALNDFGQ